MCEPIRSQRFTPMPLVRNQARHLAKTSIKSIPTSGVVKLIEERRRQNHAIYTRILTLRFVVPNPTSVGKICVVRHCFEIKLNASIGIRCFRNRSQPYASLARDLTFHFVHDHVSPLIGLLYM